MWKYKIYKQQQKSHRRINKSNLICPVFWSWPHVLIHITTDIFSGKASWEEYFGMPYPSWFCSAMMSWHAASIVSWMDDGQKPSISRLQAQTPHWGLLKGSKVQGKETSFSNGFQTMLWLHWAWWNATLLHVITYIGKWSPTCPLSLAPVFGADLLKYMQECTFPHKISPKRSSFIVYHIIYLFIYLHNINQLFLIFIGIKYKGHICVSNHNMNSCSL